MSKRTDGKDGHRERLRALFEDDPTRLREDQVLELHLFYVFRRGDTSPLAKRLLKRFKSIRGFLDALPSERFDVEGYGPGCEQYFRLNRESMARYAEGEARERPLLDSFERVAAMARMRLAGCEREEAWVALLNSQNRLLVWKRLTVGTVNEAMNFPRDVIELAIKHSATGLILVHNHPGGLEAPSGPDIELTLEVKRIGRKMGIRLLDHLVVANGECFSMHADGLLSE